MDQKNFKLEINEFKNPTQEYFGGGLHSHGIVMKIKLSEFLESYLVYSGNVGLSKNINLKNDPYLEINLFHKEIISEQIAFQIVSNELTKRYNLKFTKASQEELFVISEINQSEGYLTEVRQRFSKNNESFIKNIEDQKVFTSTLKSMAFILQTGFKFPIIQNRALDGNQRVFFFFENKDYENMEELLPKFKDAGISIEKRKLKVLKISN